mmetsp:Transcript_70753/g.152432  ORF Transcript_70753/g.152432 Transcript_70753/m.152432 type:complete len:88 (+) Transcript_70753:504-767(+)
MIDKRKSFIMGIGEQKAHETSGGHSHDNMQMPSTRTAALILSVGLLIHNIFEGMSIGLQTTPEQLLIIMIAVCSHKVITAFSLGLSF